MHRTHSYVVTGDGGYAPNVDGGVCTLCICKPRIRSTARPGDWVVGLWPAPDHKCVTYVMRIGRVLTMEEYAECGEFNHKRPAQSRTLTTYTSSIRFWDRGAVKTPRRTCMPNRAK